MQILVSTTGAVSSVVIPEFGNWTLVHPVVALDLTIEFDEDQIKDSYSLQTALDNGWITITDGLGNPITNLSDIQVSIEELLAENVSYTPFTLANWISSPTPNLVNLALDELAGRIFTIETGGGGGGISLTDLSATSPLTYSNLTGVFAINQSNGSTNGYLSSTDWTTFNNKQAALSGTGLVKSTAGTISYITDNSTNWDTAFSERRQWDGGATNLVAATGRTSLGATTVGSNLFTATGPSAITFIRINADNSVSFLDAATFRTAIGAGTSSTTGTVTTVSIVTNQGVSGSVATATTTPAITLTLGALTGITSINGLIITANTGVITTGTWSATAIAANRGGTGQTTYTIGDLLYADSTSTLAKLLDVATGNALISGGVGVAPSWGKIGLTTHITGNLPVTNLNDGTSANGTSFWRGDGVWAVPAAVVGISLPLTTKGDIFTYDTASARLPVGTLGQVLISDSSTATGLKWANADSIAGQTIRFLNANTGNSNTVVSTISETNFTSNGTSYSMPANTMKVGSLLRFLVYGKFGTKSGAVGTLTIRLKIGSLVINTTGTDITPGSNQVDVGFQFTGQIQCRTAGVSGTVASHLLCVFNGAGASAATTFCDSSNGTNTIDTTISNTIQMSAQWATSNANNTITIEQVTMEILN